ncbi:MAG: PD40 domain-containing protein [Flavobacteriales bacterium]|nr:PD40 domain-containing protein [Flavobacteriales bacterium]
MKRVFYLLITCILLSSGGLAQTNGTFDKGKLEENLKGASFRQKFEAANSLMEDQLYELSLPIWESLYKEQPENANINYKYGYCLFHANENRKAALPFLRKATGSIVKNYNPFDFAEKNAPLEAEFYLGKALHHHYDLDEAIEMFESFRTKIKVNKHILAPLIDLYITQCNNAKVEMANKKNLVIKHLSDKINTHYAEFSPVITLDESALFFTSRRIRPDSSNAAIFSPANGKHFDDIYVSYKDLTTGEWGEPELLASISNPRRNEATISVSGDGQILFVYRDEDLYFSEFDGEEYGRLQFVGKDMNTDINTKAWETHAALSADGNTLYFVSDREGGLGGRDIYRVVRLPNGNWSKALNIGPPINTPFDEDAPFFHPDGRTLFFSSNGESSMGGFDIFFTKIQDDGSWTNPESMGYPLNSVDDDIFFVTNTAGTRGYFASSKEEGGFGGEDIYLVEMDTVVVEAVAILRGHYVALPGEPIPPNSYVLVTNLTEGGDPENYTVRSRDGGYVMTLKPCNEYFVEYYADNNKFAETQFLVPCDGADYQEFGGAMNLGEISLDARYHWQILKNNEKYENGGSEVHYINKYGDILFKEPLTDMGTFTFHQVEEEIFDLKLNNTKDCDKVELALLDDSDKEIRRISINKGCIIGRDQPLDEGPTWRYQVSVNGKPLKSAHFADYIDLTNQEHQWHEPVRKDGTFRFHSLSAEGSYAFEVWLDDPTLCDDLVIELLDENNKVIRVTTIDIRCRKNSTENITGSYQEYFGYNEDGKEYEDEDWAVFIANCKQIVKNKGECAITVVGSASKVPTSSYKNNQSLANKRADQAKRKVIRALKKARIDVSKITFTVNGKVQGPSYGGDFRNTKKYGPFQYIQLTAK